MEFFGVLAGCIVAAAVFALALCRWKPHWSRGRVAMVSAGLIPAVTVAGCIYLFLVSATGTAGSCGVNSCGTEMMAAIFIAGWAVMVFAIGLAAAFLAQRLVARR